MAISKPGIISFLLGAVILALTIMFGLAGASIWAMISTAVLGGLILLGLFLMLVGGLMIIV